MHLVGDFLKKYFFNVLIFVLLRPLDSPGLVYLKTAGNQFKMIRVVVVKMYITGNWFTLQITLKKIKPNIS